MLGGGLALGYAASGGSQFGVVWLTRPGESPLKDLALMITPAGRKQLRFSTKMVNIGTGPFELRASRSTPERSFSSRKPVERLGAPARLRVLKGGGRRPLCATGRDCPFFCHR
jgi:hypothetical protein